jgi:hypothetical protein
MLIDMKKILYLAILISAKAIAGGYYYPVPPNPPGFVYALPPAYVSPLPYNYYTPPPAYSPPVVNVQPIQRGYYPPPPSGWTDSKIVPLPPKVDLLPER